MALFWFILFVIFIVFEVFSFNLITIWFALGALFAMGTTFATDNLVIQIVVFTLISLISLILFKPFVDKIKVTKKEDINLDSVIGKHGVVIKDIDEDSYGQVKVNGSVWTAKSNSLIKEGERVKVIKIDGVKLIVKKEDK